MDGSDVRYLAPAALAGTKLEMVQGTVFLKERLIVFRGLGGSRTLSLGRGWVFDLTGGVGGAERLLLCGACSGYRVVMDADVLTLTSPADGTTVRLQAGRGPHCIVFDDGWVRAGDLWRDMTQAVALSRLAELEDAAAPVDMVCNLLPKSHEACDLEANTLPEGAILQVGCMDRIETVYGPDAASQAAPLGVFADYSVTMQTNVVCLNRCLRGQIEDIYLVEASQLSFVDGKLTVETLRRALRLPQDAPISSSCGETPKVVTVALSVEPMTTPYFESWFVGLSRGGLLNGLYVGQVIEATVTFNMVVSVSDAPPIRLRAGDLCWTARCSGSSSTDTLRFTYVVTEDDVLEISMDATQVGASALDRLRLDIEVEVGDQRCDGNLIEPVSDFMPDPGNVDDRWRLGRNGECQGSSRRRCSREQAGPRMKVDVNLEDLEQLSFA